MQLLRTIFIIILVYYGFKVLARLFGPFFLKYLSKKAMQRFGGQFGDFQNQQRQQKPQNEGETVIDKIPNRKTSNNTVGEYVDYEEVD
jgi:hypothetical protein